MPNSPTLTVTHISAQAIRLPLGRPYRTAAGTVTQVPLILIELHSARGVTGRSILFAYSDMTLLPLLTLVRNMSPVEPISAATLEKQLEQSSRMVGSQGLVGMAMAGIDMALWDALAKRHQCTLVELLGGEHQRLPVYASIGLEGASSSARHAAELAARGFHGIKLCVGYHNAQQDINVIQAVRQAVGPDIELMVDYNQCLNPREALQRVRLLADSGLSWIEEPLQAQAFAQQARLRESSPVPLQCGENWWHINEVEQALHHGSSDYMMLSAMKCGGISGWLRIAELLRQHEVPLSSNLWPELSAQLLSLSPTAHWLQYSDWWTVLLKQPLQIEQGCSLASTTPGAGMDWDNSIAERYRIA
ncbi:MAG: hypothetical protein OIF57_19420 [Marinobacterium sp.]|nr:hypothetical protein [Marinobacterium sp.]